MANLKKKLWEKKITRQQFHDDEKFVLKDN